MASTRDKVRFGLVGYGAWGRHHAQAIAAHPEAELAAVVAPSEVSRGLAREHFPGVEVFATAQQMLETLAVEVVDVVAPNHVHFPIAEAALRAGCHVLLEKPMATTLPDCQALIALAAQMGREIMVGHELRLSSQWGRIKEIIDQGVIGVPWNVLVELSRRPYRLGADGWRYDPARVGDWMLEEPVHFFDLARWYLEQHGEPTTVYASANGVDATRPTLHDNVTAIVRHGTGAQATICQTLAAFGHHQTVKVTGSKGAIWASWSGATDRVPDPVCTMRVYDGESVEEVALHVPSGELVELRQEIAHCIRVVRDGQAPVANADDGLWSVGLCLAAGASTQSGGIVEMASFLHGGTLSDS